MSYEPLDTPDAWWVAPLVIGIIILGLVAVGIHMSVQYVDEEGYEVTTTP